MPRVVGGVPARRPNGAQRRLRHLLRRAHRRRLRRNRTGYSVTTNSTISDDSDGPSSGRLPRAERRTSIRSRSVPMARGSTRRSATPSASTRCWAERSARRTVCASTRASSGGGCRCSGSSPRDSASKWPTAARSASRADRHPPGLLARGGPGTRATSATRRRRRSSTPRSRILLHRQFRCAAEPLTRCCTSGWRRTDVLLAHDRAKPPPAAVRTHDEHDLRQPAARQDQGTTLEVHREPPIRQRA